MKSAFRIPKKWRRIGRQLRDHFRKEIRPLGDIRHYVESTSGMIRNTAEIAETLQAIGPCSKEDRDWANAACYPMPYIAELRNVTLVPGTRLLQTDEGQALSDEIHMGFCKFGLQPKLTGMTVSDGPRIKLLPSPRSPEPIAIGIHLMGEHETNYFHWIVEILPRLYLYEQLTSDKTVPLLVSDGLNDNLYALLAIVCAPERPIKRLKNRWRYHVSHLVYPSDLSRLFDVYDRPPSSDTMYLHVPLLRSMSAAIQASLKSVAVASPTRLFLRRKSGIRLLLNEAEIENMLLKNGFSAVNPENLSVPEQVQLFSQAEIIVSPSGAALANILWCRTGARIIVLHPDHPFKKYLFWDALARAVGAQISYLPGPRANNLTGRLQVHDDYRINPEALSRILNCHTALRDENMA